MLNNTEGIQLNSLVGSFANSGGAGNDWLQKFNSKGNSIMNSTWSTDYTLGKNLGNMMGKGAGTFGNSAILGAATDWLSQGVDKSNTTRNLDAGYDQAANAISKAGPWGAIIGGAMKIGGFATEGLNKLGFKTDQMTGKDKFLDSKFFKLTPTGLINTGFAKKTDNFAKDLGMFNSVGGYKGLEGTVDSASKKAGKKYGFFSSSERRSANKEIGQARQMQNKLSNIYDQNKLTLDAAGQTALDLAAEDRISKLGGFNPVAVGKTGMKLSLQKSREILSKKSQIQTFRDGGSIKMSIIPGGALHAHKHHLKTHDKELAKSVTDKGVPVVSFSEGGEIEQHAEIERGEIIFRIEITKQLEELWKDGSEEAMIKAGKLIAEEVVNNTKDKSEEYEINN